MTRKSIEKFLTALVVIAGLGTAIWFLRDLYQPRPMSESELAAIRDGGVRFLAAMDRSDGAAAMVECWNADDLGIPEALRDRPEVWGAPRNMKADEELGCGTVNLTFQLLGHDGALRDCRIEADRREGAWRIASMSASGIGWLIPFSPVKRELGPMGVELRGKVSWVAVADGTRVSVPLKLMNFESPLPLSSFSARVSEDTLVAGLPEIQNLEFAPEGNEASLDVSFLARVDLAFHTWCTCLILTDLASKREISVPVTFVVSPRAQGPEAPPK